MPWWNIPICPAALPAMWAGTRRVSPLPKRSDWRRAASQGQSAGLARDLSRIFLFGVYYDNSNGKSFDLGSCHYSIFTHIGADRRFEHKITMSNSGQKQQLQLCFTIVVLRRMPE